MDTQLDSESASPLYQQVFEVIKGKIETGRYPAHSQIPTESELSRMYGVGRITVRRAIEELVNEGYLTKRQGRGTFVTALRWCARFIKKMMSRALPTHAMKMGCAPVLASSLVLLSRRMMCSPRFSTSPRVPI